MTICDSHSGSPTGDTVTFKHPWEDRTEVVNICICRECGVFFVDCNLLYDCWSLVPKEKQ